MLDALARACSPLAIDLLLDQPHRDHAASPTAEDLARSRRLDRLVTPPSVVLVGKPNCGKSTLMNALTRERTSIVHDQPGATRDAVAARVDMAGLVVDLYDLPGFRDTDDAVEQDAIVIGRSLLAAADCVVSLAEPGGSWPLLDGEATLQVGTKSDLGVRNDVDCSVCGVTEQGLAGLVIAIRDVLVPPADMTHSGAWLFYSPTAL
jgi:tRNA modification GTPase